MKTQLKLIFLVINLISIIKGFEDETFESVMCDDSHFPVPPTECCVLIPPDMTKKQQQDYKNTVKEFTNKKNGCKAWISYFEKSLKVLKNDEVDVQAFEALFIKPLSVSKKDELWRPIIKKSIAKCVDDVKIPKLKTETSTCNIHDMMTHLMLCVMRQNFLRCPSQLFNKKLEVCHDIRKFVHDPKHCYDKFGDRKYAKMEFYYPSSKNFQDEL